MQLRELLRSKIERLYKTKRIGIDERYREGDNGCEIAEKEEKRKDIDVQSQNKTNENTY